MNLILLSGGSGKRLWPLSNDARSKQFLKILEHQPGHMESMVQRVWRQLLLCGLAESSIIATNHTQVDMIRQQLGWDVPILIEPERRDTFPAIALAATYLYSVQGVELDEVVVILPVDPYVEDHFFNKLKELETVLKPSAAHLALMGVRPTYPSTKYGYILPELKGGASPYYPVQQFKEKPSEDYAKTLIEDYKALWNCGVFAFRLEYMIEKLLEKGLPVQYEQLVKQYHRLPKISFDYEVVERESAIVVLPYAGEWKDLGTWNTLTEEMDTQLIGNGIVSEDSLNTHLINELDIPVVVMGVSNAVVAVSPDGVLVSDKASSPKLKDLIRFDHRPMYEESLWGSYRVLDFSKLENGEEALTRRISLHAGENFGYQAHFYRVETWTILSGRGEVILEGEAIPVKANDVVQIPNGMKHGIRAEEPIVLIEVQIGQIVQEDNVSYQSPWTNVVAR
ncbi:sugar phosphate nucleotidyltransferase [Paenibacillus koleovorans]|uniref:sugar phosphate nucleotidyltransferase n=1 Tax=Paenibacillus koleovorans TaxID=121608 RepID=UPI000FDB1DE5|nr:sugar phosphate nucleotidyltransferase [Paenibacillus koleovorans]